MKIENTQLQKVQTSKLCLFFFFFFFFFDKLKLY